MSRQDFSKPLQTLLTDSRIDWLDNCIFKDGKVVDFKIHTASNSFQMRPVPQSEQAKIDAKVALESVQKQLKPATPDQIAICLKRLSLHCGMQYKSENDYKHILLDYIKDLKDYSFFSIAWACAEYRLQVEGNNFLPKSGVLVEKMKTKQFFLKRTEQKLLRILGEGITEISTPRGQTSTLGDVLGKTKKSDA